MTFIGNAQTVRADGTKECSKCGDIKPLSEFARASKEKSGYKSACKACIRLDQAEYYRRNKPRIDEKNRKWAKEHPHRMAEYWTRYRIRNPEKHLAAVLDWQRRNPDKVIAMKARWYSSTKHRYQDRWKNWLSSNPDAARRYYDARRSRLKSAAGCFTKDDWLFLFTKQAGRCAGCGCDIDKSAHADHVIPLMRGGRNDVSNRQLLCRRCNLQKHIKPMDQFLRLKRSGLI